MEIIEAFSNLMGIFLKVDLTFFEKPNLLVRICLVMDSSKKFASSLRITSKNDSWVQKMFFEEPFLVYENCHLSDHLTSSCLDYGSYLFLETPSTSIEERCYFSPSPSIEERPLSTDLFLVLKKILSKGSLREIEGNFHRWFVELQEKIIEKIVDQVINEDREFRLDVIGKDQKLPS